MKKNSRIFLCSLYSCSWLLLVGGLLLFSGIAWWFMRDRTDVAAAVAPSMLVVGTNVGYPPFIMSDDAGEIVGFDADVAEELARRLKRTVVFKDMAFEALILSLNQGSVDMIIGGLSITNERKKSGMLLPYYGMGIDEVSVFSARAITPPATLADLAAARFSVCTQSGTLFEELVEKYEGITVKSLSDIAEIVLEVEHRRSDVGLLDSDTVRVLGAFHPALHVYTIPLLPAERIDGYGIGIAPANEALRREVQAAVEQMRADGTMDRLMIRWFGAKDTER